MYAGPRFAFAVPAILLFIGTSGCASPLSDDPAPKPDQMDRRLAARPEASVGAPAIAPSSRPTTSTAVSPTPTDESVDGPLPTPETSTPETSETEGGALETALSLADPAGDHGLEGRRYGDARVLIVSENRTTIRVTVGVAENLPIRLADGEVMGIGVDLFRDGASDESDYQLFAEGSADGWFGYLDTPGGFVEFPGAFRVAGDRVEFEVPWTSIGGRGTVDTSMFVDWSRAAVAVLATTTQDRAPDRGTATVDVAQ